jgi:hypothetical protein
MRTLIPALLLLLWSPLTAQVPRVRYRPVPLARFQAPVRLAPLSVRMPALSGLRALVPAASAPRVLPLPLPVQRPPRIAGVRVAGSDLFDQVHELAGRNFRQHDYDDARRFMFSKADNVVVNGVRGVIEVYSQIFLPGTSDHGGDYPERGDQNHDGFEDKGGMNTEHTWPQSFFAKKLPMRSDLHHLLPTFVHPNGLRGHLPFGEVRGTPEYSNDAGAKIGQGVFEPPNAAKGKVARALLYFYVRYHDKNITQGEFDDRFWNDKLEMLLRWNRTFPPDANEKDRNNWIESYQGNRNPFIDDPALADRIGLDAWKRPGRWGMGY